jgi:hypothetical protein
MAYAAPSITASGASFAQMQAGGPSGHLELLIGKFAATTDPPTAATWTATGGGSTGGALAAGTYYGVITETNGIGESKPSSEQTQITVAAGNKPRITFQSLQSGNTARNVYLGAVNGLTGGPYFLYATGITAATYDLVNAVPTNSFSVNPPTANSTGLTTFKYQLLRACKQGRLQDAYSFLCQVVDDFNTGQPSTFPLVISKLRDAHLAFLTLATLCNEIGTLIDANAGTLGTTATGIGGRKGVRTWP